MAVRILTLRIVLVGFAAIALFLGPTACRADEKQELRRLRSEVYELLRIAHDYAAALPIAELYVQLARMHHGEEHTEFATAIVWLAVTHQALGRYADAEPLYKQALSIAERAPADKDVGKDVGDLAYVYFQQGRVAEADTFFKKAIATYETVLGPESLELALLLEGWGRSCRWQNQYGEAAAHYLRATSIFEKSSGFAPRRLRETLVELGDIYKTSYESGGRR